MGLAVNDYSDIAVFQPVVNGVGGNLVAIFASRLSTALHKTGTQGTQAFWAPKKWYLYPIQTFVSKSSNTFNAPNNLLFILIKSRNFTRPGSQDGCDSSISSYTRSHDLFFHDRADQKASTRSHKSSNPVGRVYFILFRNINVASNN